MKNRLNRVNESIKRELSELIRRDITFQAQLVTIAQVDITPDLKQAHVYIGVVGTEAEQHAALAQLHKKRPRLQRELSRRVVMKFTPQLHFKLDAAGERGDRVLGILDELGLNTTPKEDGLL